MGVFVDYGVAKGGKGYTVSSSSETAVESALVLICRKSSAGGDSSGQTAGGGGQGCVGHGGVAAVGAPRLIRRRRISNRKQQTKRAEAHLFCMAREGQGFDDCDCNLEREHFLVRGERGLGKVGALEKLSAE